MRSGPMLRCLAATVVAYSVPCAAVSAQEAADHLFVKDQLKCVIDHIDKYESSPSDPVIIFLEICPDLSISAAKLATMTRYELPTVIGTPYAPGNPERHLSIKKADLKCLLQYRPLVESNDGSMVRLPGMLCGQK